MTLNIPLCLDDVTSEWLTSALREGGSLDSGVVTGFQSKVIGEGVGFMGEVVLLTLEYAIPEASLSSSRPASVILKIPTSGSNRHVGQSMGIYEREIQFYSGLQSRIGIRTPAHFYSSMEKANDPEMALAAIRFIDKLPQWMMWTVLRIANWIGSHKELGFVLLLQNVGHLRSGDQLAGCSLEDAKKALTTMTNLHARFWNSSELEENASIVPFELVINLSQVVFRRALPKFVEENKEILDSRALALLTWLDDNGIELMKKVASRPRSFLHGDFRLDNIFFDDSADEGTDEVVLLDWQTYFSGPVGIELAYFLSASLKDDDKSESESRNEISYLLEFYRTGMSNKGIDISAGDLRWEFEAGLLVLLLRVIPVEFQDMLVLGEDRGHEIAITWINRIFQKLGAVDYEKILD